MKDYSGEHDKICEKLFIESAYGSRGLRPIPRPCRSCGCAEIRISEDTLNARFGEEFYAQCRRCKRRSKGEMSLFWAILQWNSEQEEKVECLQPVMPSLNGNLNS